LDCDKNMAIAVPKSLNVADQSAIALGGLSLIGTQLWWFLGSKPKSQKAEGIQEVTITVDGGYVPCLVTVK
jgi:plastocyanin domain-containing protein